MKAIIGKSGIERNVLAVSWAKTATIGSGTATLFSVYEGHVIRDYWAREVSLTDHSLSGFVYAPSLDENYYFILDSRLATDGKWKSVREHDPAALAELYALMAENG